MLPVQGKPSYDDKVLGREKEFAKGGPDPEKEDEVMMWKRKRCEKYAPVPEYPGVPSRDMKKPGWFLPPVKINMATCSMTKRQRNGSGTSVSISRSGFRSAKYPGLLTLPSQ